MSLTHSFERRLSLNGRNAYISVTAAENNAKATPKIDDRLYLTVKPPSRSLSCSPHMLNTTTSTSSEANTPYVLLNKLNNPTQVLPSPENNSKSTTVPSDLGNFTTNKVMSKSMQPAGSSLFSELKRLADNELMPKSMPQTMCVNMSNSTTGTIPKTTTNTSAKNKLQTGMDRYILVTKRKSNARSPPKGPNPKLLKGSDTASENRYALLSNENENVDEKSNTKASKPPPIYLREQTSNTLVNKLAQTLGKDNFHVVSLKRGNLQETKVQTYSETLYRKLVDLLDHEKRNYYTYQLKSSKGLVVVIKGIDSSVPPEEIKVGLSGEGHEVKSVTNILNKDKIPQPMFKVELTFESSRIKKKGATHPIYDLRYLCNRRISVEEPFKRKDPPQCTNCQEFGHTKAYCKLPSICVRCGDVHKSVDCPHPKTDPGFKKCSNCGENHTANYRGCRVYTHIKNANKAPRAPSYAQYQQSAYPNLKTVTPMVTFKSRENNLTNILSSIPTTPNTTNKTYAQMLRNEEPAPNNSLENSIEKLIQTMNSFMTNMQSMMQDMLRNQSTLMQAFLKFV